MDWNDEMVSSDFLQPVGSECWRPGFQFSDVSWSPTPYPRYMKNGREIPGDVRSLGEEDAQNIFTFSFALHSNMHLYHWKLENRTCMMKEQKGKPNIR